MAISPAGAHPSSSSHFAERQWQLAALVALFVVGLIVAGIAVRLDDGSSSSVQRSGLTPAPRSQSVLPADSLAGTDLGGTIHRRSGNQP